MVHKILLVDDDQMIAEDFKRTLAVDPMFDLSWASSGEEAVQVITNDPRGFSVTVKDYLMPGLSGAETTKQLSKINPEKKMILQVGKGWPSKQVGWFLFFVPDK